VVLVLSLAGLCLGALDSTRMAQGLKLLQLFLHIAQQAWLLLLHLVKEGRTPSAHDGFEESQRVGHVLIRPLLLSVLAWWHHQYVGLSQYFIECSYVLLGKLESERVLSATVGVNDGCNLLERLADTPCLLDDLCRGALTFENGGLLDTLGDVDLGLFLLLTVENLRALDSLAFRLQLHRTPNLLGRLDILDLIAHAFNAPFCGRFIERGLDVGVQALSLKKCAI
jgi:hypothetical protein